MIDTSKEICIIMGRKIDSFIWPYIDSTTHYDDGALIFIIGSIYPLLRLLDNVFTIIHDALGTKPAT
jgi:hypothetical protein